MSTLRPEHIDAAIAIVDDPIFAALLEVGRAGKCAEIIATAIAKAEGEATANLISIIADIRQKSGVGAKPMLGELADAIAERIAIPQSDAANLSPARSMPETDPLPSAVSGSHSAHRVPSKSSDRAALSEHADASE